MSQHSASPINFATQRVGGLRFIKLGRLTLSFCVSRKYRPMPRRAKPQAPRLASRVIAGQRCFAMG